MSTDVLVIEKTTALQAFMTKDGLEPIIQQARDVVAGFEHDLTTVAGRAKSKSLAAKVAKLKVRLDDAGKESIAELTSKVTKVNASRKTMRETLDDLRDEAKKPVTDWEAADAKAKAEEIAKAEAEKLAAEILAAEELAFLMDDNFDRELEEAEKKETERIAKEKEESERKVAADAKVKAEKEAQDKIDKANREKQEAIDREDEAKRLAKESEDKRLQAVEQAKIDLASAKENKIQADRLAEERRVETARQAKIDSDLAEDNRVKAAKLAEDNRVKAAKLAEDNRIKAAEDARLQEIERQRVETERVRKEQEAREADTAHKKSVNNGIVDVLMSEGFPREAAIRVVTLAAKHKLPHLTINY